MSEQKRAQLIAEGVLNPDGSRKDVPPPVLGEGDAVAEAEAIVMGTSAQEEPQ